jgi:RNA polymerase-binding transcription factor DksA
MSIVKKLRIQVKKALAAIKIGKYGICEICGKPIDKARLQAYPEATTCIDCASKKKPEPEDE